MDNRNEGERRRDEGIYRIMVVHPEFVRVMQDEAEAIARVKGEVSAVDIRIRAEQMGIKPIHPNAYGAIFRNKRFSFLRHCQSTIPSRHSGSIRVWGLS